MIAASDSASKASARTSTRASDKSADNSPFAMLLTATAQQPSQKQSSAPANKDDTAQAKPPVEAADTRNDSDQTDSAPAAQTASSVSDTKRDKKSSRGDSDQTGDSDARPAQTPDPATPILVAAIPPSQQTIPQPFDITLAVSDTDAGKTTSDTVSKADPADLKTDAQPVKDTAPAPAPATIPSADEEIDPASTAPITASLSPATPADDSKPVTSKPAKPAADQAQPAETSTQAPAADAVAMVQAAMTAPAPSAATGTTAGTAASDTAPAIQIAGNAGSKTDKSSADTATPANTPSQPANVDGKPATVPGPASLPPTASPVAVAHTEMAKDNGPAKSTDDTKPAHAADAQPEVAAALPQSMPAPSLPHLAANGFGIAPPPAAVSNAAVTSAVQIKAANAEAAPDLDALAVSVAARAMSGSKQFEIRLDPPELGRVDVRLSIDASGKTQAHMTADQPQTLDLLQKDATSLTQALRDAGLDVSQGGLNFSLRGQDRQTDDGNNGAGQGRRTNLIATRAIQAVQSPGAISFNGAAADARVDIHV